MKFCDCGAPILGRDKHATLCADCAQKRYRGYYALAPAPTRLCRVCGAAFVPIDDGRRECPHCYNYANVKLRKD